MEIDSQILKQRREKLDKLSEMGIDAYPPRSERTHNIQELWDNETLFSEQAKLVKIVGRLNAKRRQGKIGFINIQDMYSKIQVFVRQDELGDGNYELFKLLDLGDFVQINGKMVHTQTGEYSVLASEIILLAKNLRPIPTVKEKEVDGKIVRYDEFADIELRYRKRYLDLLLNPESRKTFELRSKIIQSMRNFLNGRNFLEVDTPILQPLYGGANARPFTTHHNTLDMTLYLRIATELYLKRCIVGGFERVYEIGKNFRNEGMDRTHNPEFTAIEIYQAYTDLEGMMELTESMISSIVQELFGKTSITFGEHEINLQSPWRRASMLELIKEYTGEDFSDFDFEKIKAFCKARKIEVAPHAGPGTLIAEIFDAYVEEKLIQPTFVTDYPIEISPLAKNHPGDPNLVERFELFIMGHEYGNAFTELNNPLEQRRRLEHQSAMREMGDDEANVVDEDFIECLEYGMPPMGGLGIGVDRLIMLLTNNTSIKEVILFPQMKPE